MASSPRWFVPTALVTSAALLVSACSIDPDSAARGQKGQAVVSNPPAVGAAVSGTYRNLFVDWLGVSEAEVDAKVSALFNHYFGSGATAKLYYAAGSNQNGPLAYMYDTGNKDVRSEGMSYGMMIAVELDKKAEFDALWNWAKTNMQHQTGPFAGYFAWQCNRQGAVLGEAPASDGEEYFATALFFASHRWGDGTGIYDYSAEANRILDTMLHKEDMNGGVVGGVTNMFNGTYKQVVFTPYFSSAEHTDPSYHLPAFYELWGRWAEGYSFSGGVPTAAERDADRQFWLDAADASRAFFGWTTHPLTGLNPDYAFFTGEPHADYQGGTEHMDFRYDAWRTGMNWAVDYSWWAADENEKVLSNRLLGFFYGQGMASYGSLYTLAGSPLGGSHSLGLVSTNAATALAATDEPSAHAQEFVQALWDAPPQFGNYRYYDGLLQFLSFLHVSGRFRAIFPTGGCLSAEQSCADGQDDDCDGSVDCADADCSAQPACDVCGNGTCVASESSCSCPADCGAPPAEDCDNDSDDDCDAAVDCSDLDCSAAAECQAPPGSLALASIFGSGMVLQRQVSVPIFGQAAPGAPVSVQFQGQEVLTSADANGDFEATLAPMEASSGPSNLIVSSGPDTIVLSGVQVGEVWLCSGQSNMGWKLTSSDGAAPYIAAAGSHDLSLFRMHNDGVPSTSSWQDATPSTAADFSAVCYWMGLDLSESLDVPVGLIQATFDGSAIQEWQHAGGGSGVHYDAMVRPLMPFAVKGVLWYQGESNGGDAGYGADLAAMIAEWRSDWGLVGLPFGIVQLPAAKWSASRLGQYNVVKGDANAFLVVTHDLPGSTQLHPTAKYEVGIRSAIGARGRVYGQPIVYSGPVPTGVSVSGNSLIVSYGQTGSGLLTSNGSAPGPFELAGSNGRFSSATATIVGNTIVVTSSRVSAPTAVRYGTSGNGNVINSVSIPTEGGHTVTSLPGSLYTAP